MALLDAFRSRKWLRTATDLEDSSATTESKAFLDKVGLATLWAKIKTTFATKAEVEAKADQATTLAGYGITDAKISDGTITLGANSITPITSHQSLSNYATKTDLAAKLDVSGTAAKATADASGNNIVNTYAKKASPELTGIPKAPTAAKGTNTTQIATTEFVQTAMADKMAMPSVVECNGNEVEDSPLVLTPDTAYICTFDEGYPTLYIESFPSKDNGDDASQYLRPCFIQFFVEYAETFGIDYPRGLLWANGEIPTFEDNTWYQMSVLNGCAVVTKFVAV